MSVTSETMSSTSKTVYECIQLKEILKKVRRYNVSEWEKKLNDVEIRKEDMNKLVMNYLAREGYALAALTFYKESGTDLGMNAAIVDAGKFIKMSIVDGEIDQAINFLEKVYPELLLSNELLQFHLQQQKMIELIRRGHREGEVLMIAQTHIAPLVAKNPQLQEEIGMTMTLLVFGDSIKYPGEDLLGLPQRLKTAKEAYNALVNGQNDNARDPMLCRLLKMLMWVQDKRGDNHKMIYPHMNLSTGALHYPSQLHMRLDRSSFELLFRQQQVTVLSGDSFV